MHQLDDLGDVHVAFIPEALDDDLADRSRAVHQRQQLGLVDGQLVVKELAGVRDQGVVVAPSQPEDPQLDVGRELRPELGGIQPGRELIPQGTVAEGARSDGCLEVQPPPPVRCRVRLQGALQRNTLGAFRITDIPCGMMA